MADDPTVVPFPARLDAVRSAMRDYAGGEDSPPMKVLAGLLDLTAHLDRKMDDLKAQSPDVVERTLRQMLHRIQPEFVSLWTWRRRAWVIGAAVSAAAVVVCCASLLAFQSGRQLGATDGALWKAWWDATCSANGPNIVVTPKGRACQIPVAVSAEKVH